MEGGDPEQRWQRQANVSSKRADGTTTNRVRPRRTHKSSMGEKSQRVAWHELNLAPRLRCEGTQTSVDDVPLNKQRRASLMSDNVKGRTVPLHPV